MAELLASSLNPSSGQFEEFKLKEAPVLLPLPDLDPGEDTKTDSLDALDESEEELVQVKALKKKASRVKKSPEQIASTFAEEASMAKIINKAVSAERALHKAHRNSGIDNLQLADLWSMISTEKRGLKQRYMHYEFSRQFWAEMGELNRSPHQHGRVPKAIISNIMSKLEVTNQTNWKYILQQARRASVWTELADIFKDDLEHPSVVLCAVPDATYTWETMTLANRNVLFQTIRSRIKEPGNGILARLKAASGLYSAAMHNGLPTMDLNIETVRASNPATTNTAHCLVWTSGMDYSDIRAPEYFENFTIPQPDLGNHSIALQTPFFSPANFSGLEKALGHGFAFSTNRMRRRRIHQGVAMMEVLKFNHHRDVAYKTLPFFFSPSGKDFPSTCQASCSEEAYSAVIILDYDSDPECVEKLNRLSRLVQQWSGTGGRRLRLFPLSLEMNWDFSKVNDIHVLDELAKQAAESGEHDLAYRPKTCYTKELCTLSGRDTVLKASHSSETKYIQYLKFGRDPKLQCREAEDVAEIRHDDNDPWVYFHQETISTLNDIGEFRVLIATVPNSRGLRGREPNIVAIVHTSFKDGLGRTPFFPLSGSEAFWIGFAPLNIDKLREYALFVFNALRKRPDWKDHYETLEVGVRLDIGISLDLEYRRFFVNEITRFQQGCWFSTSGAPPYLGVVSAFARALNDYFPLPDRQS